MLRKSMFAGALALAAVSTVAVAAVTFDSATGTGFVGKGDVQLALGMNNAQVQNATLSFTYDSTVVSEVSWICTNDKNEQTQERARTTTSSSTGVVSAVARVKNQVTGYNLNGYQSGSTSSTSSTDGPPVDSCPNANGNWSLTTPASDAEVVSSTGGLFVNGAAL
jgi:hypothetical protein